MKAQAINRELPSFPNPLKSDAIKKCLLVLILTAAVGTLEVVSLSGKFQQRSWPFSLCSSFFHSKFFDNLIQDKYLPENDDLAVDDSKKFHTHSSIVNTVFLTSPLNSQWEIFFVSINSLPHPSFFAILPLRSPPLFS